MKLVWWSWLLVLASSENSLRGERRDFHECGVLGGPLRKGRRARIVHGRAAERCVYRWQVSIQSLVAGHPWHFCGGTLIAPDWVLTAAHCAAEITNVCNLRNIRIVSSDWKKSSNEAAVTRTVKKVYSSPTYNVISALDGDFTLMQLDQPMPITDCIGTACLPKDSSGDRAGAECSITGWGTTSSSGPTPDTLQEAPVTLLNKSSCVNAYAKENDTVTDNMLCASGHTPGGITDSCQGDSGGPLICQEDGRFVVRGVTSWGEGCGVEGFPGVYARVSTALSWIRDVMDGKVKQSDFDTDSDVDFGGAMWAVVAGDCVMDAQKCISSPHFPQNYTSADYCRIAVNHTAALPIEVEGFETESNYDTLTVNCEAFSGSQRPDGLVPVTDIFWSTDATVTATGWKICPSSK